MNRARRWLPLSGVFFTPSGPFAAGGILSEIAFGVLVGWILGCSVTMLVKGKPATAT